MRVFESADLASLAGVGVTVGEGEMSVSLMSQVRREKVDGYRLARKHDGQLILQGCYHWSDGTSGGQEWREIPTVELTEEPTK